ncbi:Purine nucleoside phosphorylase 1 [Hyphomicrobiales bacterium]|nr:Purine nucleoside phosphorylase 1 [Hyphomicrobiales bacterium]CAH1674167.1 Purine nucleoside phosphorylase 1 [Hyphomicrobiales bacterium]
MTSVTDTSTPLLYQARAALEEWGVMGPFDHALVLGTGLGNIIEDVEGAVQVPYAAIPGFPDNGPAGQPGQLVSGYMEGKRVLIYAGRAHYYETGHARTMALPIALLGILGKPPVLLTNAAGSVKSTIRVGSLCVITDHINFSGLNPLIGDREDGRFVDMVDAYDNRLRRRLKLAAIAAGIALNEGVYMWFSGPSFETPAEIRMARTLGAELVGMSTVPEVILARRHGLRVSAISVVTSYASGFEDAPQQHGPTKDITVSAAAGIRRIIRGFVSRPDEI